MARRRTIERQRVANGRSYRISLGTVRINTLQSASAISYKSQCDDEVSTYFGLRLADHGLFIERWEKHYSNLNGRDSKDPLTYNEYTNWDVHYNRAFPGHILYGLPSDGSSMATAMARSNPSAATVPIPSILVENLRDLPLAIHRNGANAIAAYFRAQNRSKSPFANHHYAVKKPHKNVPADLADAYITLQFAILPLISDVKKLLNFQAAVDRRCKELDKLYSKGGIRRRVELVSETLEVQTPAFTVASNLGHIVKLRSHKITKVRRWATCRWLPTSPPSFNTDQEKRALASSLVSGMNVQGLTKAAWEAIPWSFLADWFANASDVLGATNNALPATCVGRCLMTHVKTTTSYSREDGLSWLSGGDGTFTYETKMRSANVGVSLNASLPFLNGSQLSILGALSVSRT